MAAAHHLWGSRRRKLDIKSPELINKLILSPRFFACLRKYKVLQEDSEIEDLKTEKPSQQKWAIIKRVKMRSDYIGFIRSLVETSQLGVVTEVLEEEQEMFKSDHSTESIVKIISETEASEELTSQPTSLTRYQVKPGKKFGWLRNYYLESLTKTPVFENTFCTSWCEVEDTFTKLRLQASSPLVKDTAANTIQEALHRRTSEIALDELFVCHDGQYISALVEGRPGSGKSTLIQYSIIEWSKGKSDLDGGEYSKAAHDYRKDMVLLVNKKHERSTLEETLSEAIRVAGHEKIQEGLAELRHNSRKCLIFYDAIDEFSNKDVVEEIFETIKRYQNHVIVSCRAGHPYLRGQRSIFRKTVEVFGFNSEEVSVFTVKYMESINVGNKVFGKTLGERLASLLMVEERQRFFKNPLNLVLLCQLYREGDITDQEILNITLLDLYKLHQDLLLQHECQKRALAHAGDVNRAFRKELDRLKTNARDTLRAMHRLALHSLLAENKLGQYKQEQLVKFGIDAKSPAMVLFQREVVPSEEGEEIIVYSWPHQTMREFHAAEAAQDKEVLFAIASKPELSHVYKFLVPILAKRDGAVNEFLTAVLLFQSSPLPCLKAGWAKKAFSSLFKKGHKCEVIPEVQKALSDVFENSKDTVSILRSSKISVEKLCRQLPRIQDIAKCVQNTGWAWENRDVLERLMEVISECGRPESVGRVFNQIIRPCLPSVLTDLSLMKAINSDYSDEDEKLAEIFSDVDSDDDIPGVFKPLAKGINSLGSFAGKAAASNVINGKGELHAVYGEPRLLILFTARTSMVGKMMTKLGHDSDDDVDDDEDDWMNEGLLGIIVARPSDILRMRLTFRQFASKVSGRAKNLELSIGEEGCFALGNSADDDPEVWKRAILYLAEVFKMDMRVPAIPGDESGWPGEKDLKQLKKFNVGHLEIGARDVKL